MDPIRMLRLRSFYGTGSDVTVTRVHLWRGTPVTWQPPINAFRCEKGIRICVDLAGVEKSAIDLRLEPTRVVVRGAREAPEPSGEDAAQILALEIDYGQFERTIELPVEVDVDGAEAKQENGLLWISLPNKK
jgi:HSP20 family protein